MAQSSAGLSSLNGERMGSMDRCEWVRWLTVGHRLKTRLRSSELQRKHWNAAGWTLSSLTRAIRPGAGPFMPPGSCGQNQTSFSPLPKNWRNYFSPSKKSNDACISPGPTGMAYLAISEESLCELTARIGNQRLLGSVISQLITKARH